VGRLKMRDWKYRHQTARVENAGPSSYGKPPAGLELSLLLLVLCFQLSSNGFNSQLVNARDVGRVSGQGGQTFVR